MLVQVIDGGGHVWGRVFEADGLTVIVTLAWKVKAQHRVALLGGLASAIEAWLSPDVRRRLTPPVKDAVSGAIALARTDGVSR